VKHPKHVQTKAQHVAALKFAAGGRAAQARTRAAAIAKTGKPPARSKAQRQATLRFAAAGRAAQARKRNHLKPLAKTKPALALPGSGLHDLPVCGPVAIAEHLLAATGVYATDDQIIDLANRTPGGCLADYLEQAATGGLAGVRLARFCRCDCELAVPGLVYEVQFRTGYHAVLMLPGGMLSWGMLLPVTGRSLEAWALNWDDSSY
jgi:hypothetical protein